jgi:uncharacterized phiE125 gp8 family phage protein
MLKIVTAPSAEPTTVAEAKAHAVVDFDDDDTLIGALVSAARAHGEALTGRSWAEQTLEVVLDDFPVWEIELPRGPVTSVTSIKYIDIDGDEQTLEVGTDYTVDIDSVIARIVPVTYWPVSKQTINAVRVRYVAGWTADTIPAAIKAWIWVRVSTLYAQRESHTFGQSKPYALDRSFCDSLLDEYTIRDAP